jgi:hypothetical protein
MHVGRFPVCDHMLRYGLITGPGGLDHYIARENLHGFGKSREAQSFLFKELLLVNFVMPFFFCVY